MSTPTPREYVEALRDWGCDPYPAHKDWDSWCRPGLWTPVGVVHHHTGGGNTVLTKAVSQEAMMSMLIQGRPDLHGPLCHNSPHMVPGTNRARVALVGWGKANHAGKGSSKTASRVKAGAYRGQAPGEDDTDGNPLFLGQEYMHPGRPGVPWPDVLIDVGARAACAFMESCGFPRDEWPGRQVEHREWTTRKIDRSYGGDLRADVARVIEEGRDAMGIPEDTWGVRAKRMPATNPDDPTDGITYGVWLRTAQAAAVDARDNAAAAMASAEKAAAAALAAAAAAGRTEAAVAKLAVGGIDLAALAKLVAKETNDDAAKRMQA